jgi:4-amino-4-deoxy-L-arabinose transferase-like glycosyltransferase
MSPHHQQQSFATTLVKMCSIIGLIWLLAARVLGPSDLWDQTQPKTVSYTTDIIIHGGWHWLLPVERGELPATKPPLYNWLAVPAVRLMGFDSEIAHKLPSVVSLLACWLILVRLGRAIGVHSDGDESLGWLASMIFVANYSAFKLGYLARPDMLLTLWLLIAWGCATCVFIAARSVTQSSIVNHQSTIVAFFWLAITLAGLTKGPAAFVGVAYAVIAARVIGGRWSAIARLRPLIGLLLVASVCGAWVFGIWKIDPNHLRQELWFNEIWGRVTGAGTEGTAHGAKQWLRELPVQGAYYMTRFVPWSFIALIALYALIRSRMRDRGLMPSLSRQWAFAGAVFALITVGLFTLSTGKRADYIAIAFPQSSLLVAWWFTRSPPGIAQRLPWLVPAAAAVVLVACTWVDSLQPAAPSPDFGEAILRFARQANDAIAADPAPVHTVGAGQTHLQALMGISQADARHDLAEIIARNGEHGFWVVAGRLQNPPHEFDLWIERQRRLNAEAIAVVRSDQLPLAEGWQQQVSLWRVRPRPAGDH